MYIDYTGKLMPGMFRLISKGPDDKIVISDMIPDGTSHLQGGLIPNNCRLIMCAVVKQVFNTIYGVPVPARLPEFEFYKQLVLTLQAKQFNGMHYSTVSRLVTEQYMDMGINTCSLFDELAAQYYKDAPLKHCIECNNITVIIALDGICTGCRGKKTTFAHRYSNI